MEEELQGEVVEEEVNDIDEVKLELEDQSLSEDSIEEVEEEEEVEEQEGEEILI
jgi:hypothetical protein